MKKLFCMFLSLALIALGTSDSHCADKTRLSIVTTIFPEYDFVREILGSEINNADLTLLLDNGVDLHSYQPAVDDMIKIAECDLFIYVGGESDEWTEDALKNVVNKNQIALNLLDVLGALVKPEEIIEGMEAEDEDSEHGHEDEADEHVWLSLKNAQIICKKIAEAVSKLDPEHKEIYSDNTARYIEKLSELDKKYQEAVNNSARKIILFGDRFPFRYMADDYGLKYYAAFSGCSAETEASFKTVMFLADKTEELGLPCVLTIEGTKHKIAETVTASTKSKNQKVLSMNSMQSTTMKDINDGADYLSIMERNLEVLKEALN